MIEDASAGVQAAKAGGMAAIGVARADDAGLLAAAGADLVVTTLDDVDTTAMSEGRLARRQALCRVTMPSRRHWAADEAQSKDGRSAYGTITRGTGEWRARLTATEPTMR